MKKIFPKVLKSGDTIGLLSVAGNVEDCEITRSAAKYFENKGFKTIISDTTFQNFRYMAGADKNRANALNAFFADDNIDAIVCTRGGYGTLRILDKIDYHLVKKNPKIFCGFSDITALLLMIFKRTGLVTFHGPMANPDFSSEICEFTEKSFLDAVSGVKNKIVSDGICLKKGVARGVLWGGNLTVIASMAGLDFVPETSFVFFVEDVNEPAYKIDRMMTQLLHIKAFSRNLAGIALGEFSGCDDNRFVQEIFTEIANALNIPVCTGFKISHESEKITVPVGANCVFDSGSGSIELF